MAQLIKLERCISRYHVDIYRYAGRFIHQKNRRFEQHRKKHQHEPEQKIRESFYRKFFQQQLIWATKTAKEESSLSEHYRLDLWLRLLLRRLDDTVLVLYEPVLSHREALVPIDIILITPFKAFTLKVLIGEKGSVFQPHDRRQWKEIRSDSIHYVLNPLISLQRTTEVVRRIFKENNIQREVNPLLLVPESFVEFSDAKTQDMIIDKTKIEAWFKSMASYRSTLKKDQLRAAEILLQKSEVASSLRV